MSERSFGKVAHRILFAALFTTSFAQAGAQLTLTAGVGGMVKEKRHASARVVVDYEGETKLARLFVRAKSGDEITSEATAEVSLSGKSRKQFELPLHIETGTTEVEAELRAGAEVVARQSAKVRVVDESERLIVALGAGTGIEDARGDASAAPNSVQDARNWMYARVGAARPQVATVESWSDLPSTSIGFDALDGLALVGAPPRTVPPQQARALLDWVRQGGTLVVATRDDDRALQASFLGALSPRDGGGSLLAHDWTGLQHFAGVTEPFTATGPLFEVPAVFRYGWGKGRVAMLSFDPRREPFKSWKGRKQFWAALLRWTLPNRQDDAFGWSLSWRLRELLHSMDIIQVLPRWALAGPPMVYGAMLIIVAFFVARLGGRKEKAWLILGGMAIAFAIVFHLAFRGRTHARAALAGISITDVFSGEATARTTLIMNLFSPAQRHLNLSVGVPNTEFQLGEIGYWGLTPANAAAARRDFGAQTSRLEGDILRPWNMTLVRAAFESRLAGPLTLRAQAQRDGSTNYRLMNGDRYPLLSPRFGYYAQATSLKSVPSGQMVETIVAARPGPPPIQSLLQLKVPKSPGPRRQKIADWLLDVLGQIEYRPDRAARSMAFAVSTRPPVAVNAAGFDAEWYHFMRVHQATTSESVRQVTSYYGAGLYGSLWVKQAKGSEVSNDNTVTLTSGETIIESNREAIGNRFAPPPPLGARAAAGGASTSEGKWTVTIIGDTQGASVTCGVYNWNTGTWTEWKQDGPQKTSPDLGSEFALDQIARVRFVVRGGKFKLRSMTWNRK